MKDDYWNEVDSSEHYNRNTVETIDLIRDSMEPQEFREYLKGNIFKYVSRYRYKDQENPIKDLLKARWYLEKLIEVMREENLASMWRI
jgi:hypothetical protein